MLLAGKGLGDEREWVVAESDEELMLLKKLEALGQNGVGLKEFCVGGLKDLLGEGGTCSGIYHGRKSVRRRLSVRAWDKADFWLWRPGDSKAFRGTSR